MTRPNFTSINVIIDESGSMFGLKADTIGGFNTFLEEQKKASGNAVLTLTKFNTSTTLVHDTVPIADVPPLTAEAYVPSGGTALYDAMANTINLTGKRLAALKEEQRPDKVIFLVITDGEENSSREFAGELGRTRLKDMVEHQRFKYSWEFVFLAANIDAPTTGMSLGFAGCNSVQYTSSQVGTQALYSNVSKGMSSYRAGTSAQVDFLGTNSIEVDKDAQKLLDNMTKASSDSSTKPTP